jgi:hypothetical protein
LAQLGGVLHQPLNCGLSAAYIPQPSSPRNSLHLLLPQPVATSHTSAILCVPRIPPTPRGVRSFDVRPRERLARGTHDREDLVPGRAIAYGQSVTDACIGWEKTQTLLQLAYDRLA